MVVDTCEPSTRIFRVCADPFNNIVELNELNNCATKSIIFCEAPELYVKEIYFEPECALLGEMIDIFAVVADTGEASASAILKFYYLDHPENNWSDTIFIASAGIDHIEAGDTIGVAVSVPWEVVLDSTYIYIQISYTYPHDYYPDNNHASTFFRTYKHGDANGDRIISTADIVYLINYLFIGGPEPIPCLSAGDANCDTVVNIADVVYLINYLFINGPSPCSGGPELFAKTQSTSAELVLYASGQDKTTTLFVDGKFSVDVSGLQLELKWDKDRVKLANVLQSARADKLGLYHNNGKDGELKIGMVDVSGKESIGAGEGTLLKLELKSKRGLSDLSNLEIKQAILVDRSGRKLAVNITNRLGGSNLPEQFSLSQNYPNPFNPQTVIQYALPYDCEVEITIYNILGQKVKTLIKNPQKAGYNRVEWDCKNDKGEEVSSGIYFYKIEAGGFTQTKKMVILK